jgi:hypothetical protein
MEKMENWRRHAMEEWGLENEDWENTRRIRLTDVAVYERMMLKSILKKEDVNEWTKFNWLR